MHNFASHTSMFRKCDLERFNIVKSRRKYAFMSIPPAFAVASSVEVRHVVRADSGTVKASSIAS